MQNKKSLIASIENEFIMKAHYSLSAVEQKIVLYLASRINPKVDKEFHKQVIPIKELEKVFLNDKDIKWGSVYSYLETICDKLLDKTIRFNKPLLLNGKIRALKGRINWFQHILVVENEHKQICIEFKFSDMMKPFLLQLSKYVKLNILDVMEMQGKYAIHMYQVFKSERAKTRLFTKFESVVQYDLLEFREYLDIVDKYGKISNLRRRVIEPIISEINEYSEEIRVRYEYIKRGKSVIGLKFFVSDAPLKMENKASKFKDFVPSEEDLSSLTNAHYKGYLKLVDYGVIQGIAYKQILPTIRAGDILGFEDIFINSAITYFDQNTNHKNNQYKAGAFVKWWTENKVFSDKNDIYWKLHEKAYSYKKNLKGEAKINREIAKDISRKEFEKYLANK